MDTTETRATYERLAETAALGPAPAPDGDWSTEKIVAHVIATNRTLCLLGMQLLDGRETSYEGGTLSVRDSWLDSIIAAGGDFAGLQTSLRQSYDELLALAHRFDDATGEKEFPATIYDGRGNVQYEGPLSFTRLVTRFLVNHMRNHTAQVASLRGASDVPSGG